MLGRPLLGTARRETGAALDGAGRGRSGPDWVGWGRLGLVGEQDSLQERALIQSGWVRRNLWRT